MAWRDPVDWKVCHSGSEAPAALRDVRRNLMRVRVIAGITGSPGVAVDVGQVAITVMAVGRDVRRVVSMLAGICRRCLEKSPTEVGRWSCRSGEHGTSIPASFRRAGSQLPATVRPTGTKKSPGLGVGASLDERKARGLGGLRDLPFAISTPIAPIRSPLQIVAHDALRADRHSEPGLVASRYQHAIRVASSLVMRLAAARRPGSVS
jgi:hypothetical protein